MLLTAERPVSWNEQTVDQLELRKVSYQLLVDFISEAPTLEMWMHWRNDEGLNRLAESFEGARLLQVQLQQPSLEEIYALNASLSEQYSRLFGITGQLPVVPCETMYRAKEQMLPRSYAQDVCGMYADFSLYFKKVNGEPDDHIAVELEFMAVLIEKMMNSVMTEMRFTRYMNGQREFITQHLQRWVPLFADDVVQHAQHPVYQAIGLLLAEFIEAEAAWANQS
ncbi:TorD/DmsD family molecular chaperone [Paenibacillus sp. 481]|uniref:TorD/DmsD family molecular chaperone n=1 Tax=Paenibacillus sp. 481 TaxID=2835869 RepID=UPI001E3AB893|nr:molecular chaperone TorD family protein [Paenibacillus sp. 481]UHA75604.1 molecular chaperone TorD family protein [Paenibacillus sp. 481]